MRDVQLDTKRRDPDGWTHHSPRPWKRGTFWVATAWWHYEERGRRPLQGPGLDIYHAGRERMEAERKAARALSQRLGRDVRPREVLEQSLTLWGRSLTDTRDALANGTRGQRGHMTRALMDQLYEALRP